MEVLTSARIRGMSMASILGLSPTQTCRRCPGEISFSAARGYRARSPVEPRPYQRPGQILDRQGKAAMV